MGQNLKSWQKYTKTLSNEDYLKASSYMIGAMCGLLTQKQIGECLKVVKEWIIEGAGNGKQLKILAKIREPAREKRS